MEETTEFSEKFVLLDIEGTTTSIKFVKDILFPYVRQQLTDYVEENWFSKEFQVIVALLKKQCEIDKNNQVDGLIPIVEHENEKKSVVQNVIWQMDLDRKTSVLKKLQGYIWRSGYASGKIKGHVYEDVEPVLRLFKQVGKKLYIYSSGSIEAQELLFEHSVVGNILELFSGHFDTEIGPKVKYESYLKIANVLDTSTENILFLTDVIEEANAAIEAGCKIVIVERPNNVPLSDQDKKKYIRIQSFYQLKPIN